MINKQKLGIKKARTTILFIVVALITTLKANAQYDVVFSHYFDMPTSFNPATTGNNSQLNVVAAYSNNFTGFENNPRTMYASVDAPVKFFNTFHGLGANFTNDQIGLFTHQKIALQYSIKKKLFKGTLSLGLQGAMIAEQFDGTKIDLEETNDPAFPTTKENGNSFDLGAGAFFQHKKVWYVGLSAQHLTAPKIMIGERNELNIATTAYLTAGYNIQLRNPYLTIAPSMLVRTDFNSYRADITARLVYSNEKRKLYAGASYSVNNSVAILIGGTIKGFMLAYSYEFYTSAISFGNGNHEIFLGYQTEIKFAKKGKNKHQMVRTL